jgi:transposase InsO family protein
MYLKARLKMIQEKRLTASHQPNPPTSPLYIPESKSLANFPHHDPSDINSERSWECAGSATALSVDPSDPSAPIISDADFRWNADTGATCHMTPHRHWFQDYTPLIKPIYLANNQIIYSAGVGSVLFNPIINGKPTNPIRIQRVLHVPALRNNLLAVLYLTQNSGIEVNIIKDQLTFTRDGQIIFTATCDGSNAAYLNGHTNTEQGLAEECANVSKAARLDLSLWHRRLSHLGLNAVKQLMNKRLVDGLLIDSLDPPDPICEPCIHGKQHRDPFPKQSESRSTELLGLIHSDLHGPLPPTMSGFRYWITFIDDKSRYVTVYLLKSKDGAFSAFKQFKALAENQLGSTIKTLRDDKGGEYMSNAFNQFLVDAGIARQHTARASPQQNGVAERLNRTIHERLTSMLHDARLPARFWGEAITNYIHVHNRCPTVALTNTTPYEAWHKKKPSVAHLRVFGCTAYVHVQKDQRKNLQSHTIKCVFLGYPQDYKAWRFWNPDTQQIVISRDVIFDERPHDTQSSPPMKSLLPSLDSLSKSSPCQRKISIPIVQNGDHDSDCDDDDSQCHQPSVDNNSGEHTASPGLPAVPIPTLAPAPVPPTAPPILPDVPPPAPPPDVPTIPSLPLQQTEPHSDNLPQPRRSTRIRHSPKPFWIVDHSKIHRPPPPGDTDDESLPTLEESGDIAHLVEHGLASSALYEPKSYQEALSCPDASLWERACQDEYQSLMENETWELVPLPPDRKAIGSRWVFTIKYRADGSIERYKARFVAKGYAQQPGLDFTDTFAPVAKLASIRAVLALAAIEDLELDQLDFKTAFLNGDIEEELYIEQPEGFREGNLVCRLKKAIYGIKQAPRQWYLKLHQLFCDLGFRRLESDHSLYVWTNDNVKVIIPVYVDDLVLACNDRPALDFVKRELGNRFQMKDLGPAKLLLGLEITRDRPNRRLYLGQQKYCRDVLERFQMSTCKPVITPIDPNVHLVKSPDPLPPEQVETMRNIPYLSAVGSLMYLAQGTRPDIAYAVGVLSQFMKNPGPPHWKAVQRVFRYLKGTMDYKLTFGPSTSGTQLLTGFSDADFGGNLDTRRSTSGYIFYIGSGPVSWSSKLQPTVALSTGEAEYTATVHSGKEAVWLRTFLTELGYNMSGPTLINVDNQSALAVAENPEHHSRMKHLDIQYHWIREKVAHKQIVLNYIPTNQNVADIFTKGLNGPRQQLLRSKLNLAP